MQLKPLPFTAKSIAKAIPGFLNRKLAQLDAGWRDAVAAEFGEDTLASLTDPAAVGYRKELPALVRVGTIRPRGKEGASYFAGRDFPALIDLRNRSAIIHSSTNPAAMAQVMQGYLLRIIGQLDPSVVQCTIIDQRDFGSAFAVIGSTLKNPHIITDRYGVDELFRKLTDDLTQRNRTRGHAFRYLHEYNRAHADSAVPYHFVLVASYEDDLAEEHQATLGRMLANDNAAKAGIYFLILHRTSNSAAALRNSHPQLPGLLLLEFPEVMAQIAPPAGLALEILDDEGLCTGDQPFMSRLIVTSEFDDAALGRLAEVIRQHAHTRRVESVNIALPAADEWDATAWRKTSADGLEAIVGKARGMPLAFRLGAPEIVHNALVGGAVGTGKTNLLHAIIVQCLAHYSPEELRLSLLDYKNGTEFNVYAGVPHLHALSLGSGTKFGTDLLQHFKRELERRAELFKQAGVTSLAGYRSRTGKVLPRHLVVIDEFQVLLGDRRLGYLAQADLEDLIRRGRSFGFNFILASQSLKDCTLSSPAKSNVGCRICLKLSESDCSDFLSVENTVPSRFQEVGQALLNNQEGRLDGNVEFRVAYYPDQRIADFCALLAARAPEQPAPYIYRGDDRYAKSALASATRAGELLIGIEEGIPLIPHGLALDPARGPVYCCGAGKARELFEANLADEAARNGCAVRHVDGLELEALLGEAMLAGGTLADTQLITVSLRQRDSMNPTVQSSVSQLVLSPPCKVILYVETAVAFRNLYLDRNAADFLLCFDQRSYAEFGMGRELASQPDAAALLLPGEQDAIIVKIPQTD